MEGGFRKMATRFSKNTTFLLLTAITLLLDLNAIQGRGRLSEEEDIELDRQLQVINKPAIKSFRTECGDIVDCIDILKQPAFDHPLLKNHTIQMEPKTIPKGMEAEGSSQDVFPAYGANISCPPGSVPIKRTTKEDLIMDKYQKSARRNYPANKSWRTSAIDLRGFHSAALAFNSQSYGAKARINVWNLTVSADQYSTATMQIVNASIDQLDKITAGWQVRQWNYTRLYTSWTAGGSQSSGCIDVVCPGFVQVSSNITLGIALHPTSTYDGPQYEIRITLYQDHATGNWWFMLQNQYIGYWPKALFTGLAQGANGVSWGGQVYSPIAELSPAMGSSHFPEESYGKSAYVREIKVITDKTNVFVDPDNSTIEMNVDSPYCYNAFHKVDPDPQWAHHMYFGGPGNCTFN